MVIYNKQEKIIIIPEGGGTTTYNPRPSCEEAIEQARAEQEAIDEAKLTDIVIRQNGTYQAPYGYKTVGVDVDYWRYASVKFDVNYETCLPLPNFGFAPVRSFKLYVNNVEYELGDVTGGGGCGVGVSTTQWFKGETSIPLFQNGSVEFALSEHLSLDNLVFYNMVNNYGTDMEQQISGATMTTEYLGEETVEFRGETHIVYWYRLNFNTYGCGIYDDWQLAYDRGRNEGFQQGYQAGLAACQSGTTKDNVIIVWNNYSEANNGPWIQSTIRDLMINGVASPYQYEKNSVFGKTVQFNLENPEQIPMPSSLTFTVDSQEVVTAPDVTRVKVFGQEISNFSVVKASTTPIQEGNIGTTYTITIN